MATKHATEFKNFRPSAAEADHYWQQWMTLNRYRSAEEALARLFRPRKDKEYLDRSDLLIKCSTLNDFYSTSIYSVYRVVEHYMGVENLGQRMAQGDLSLVEELRNVPTSDAGERTRDFYSFATKFCAHHNAEAFPIYDSYVDKMLRELRNRDRKLKFLNNDLKDYRKFRDIVCRMREAYGITNLTFRQVDIMLWLAGKEYFPITYK
ncbi:MAG: hypothetical protein IJ524_05230 [Bacteroidales bacterium]|nr:hypothetical protein [Bacteroidales bacterium]